MIEILFRNREEAKFFYSQLRKQLASFQVNEDVILYSEKTSGGLIKITAAEKNVLEAVRKATYYFIFKIKLHDWFRMTLKDQYFYSDEEEQRQIIDIIYSILEGTNMDFAPLLNEPQITGELEKAIADMYEKNRRFAFDSFVKFRLRPLLEQLNKYIKVSIDEYKMEQEYQMFIQTLREFLVAREAKIARLHLEIRDEVKFFDEQFVEIKRSELLEMVDRRLLYNHPLYIDSTTIAPLLSLAPSVIFLYTNERDNPLVRTICNIFEERVKLLTLQSFPRKKDL